MRFVVLPAFNEEEATSSLIDQVQSLAAKRFIEPVRVIVVDDGSQDAVLGYDPQMVTLVRHECNKGLGETLRTGLLAALESADEKDIIVTMDADNTHSPDHLFQMILRIEEGCDVVIAGRTEAVPAYPGPIERD